MNIARNKLAYLKLFFSILVILFLTANFSLIQLFLLKPKKINIFYSNNINENIKNEITKKLSENIYFTNAKSLFENTKEYMPELEKIRIENRSSQSTNIYLKASQPYINLISATDNKNKFILTNNGSITTAEDFNESSINNLFNLYLADEFDKNNKDLIYFALNINVNLFGKYIITWHSTTKVVLRSLEYENLEIISDVKSINDLYKIQCAIKIYQNKLLKNKITKVDIRFKDMLIWRAS